MASKRRSPHSAPSAEPAAGAAPRPGGADAAKRTSPISARGLLMETWLLLRRAAPSTLAVAVLVQLPLVLLVVTTDDSTALMLGYPLVGLIGEGAILHIGLAATGSAHSPSVIAALREGVKGWFDLFSTVFFGQLMILVMALPAAALGLYAFKEKSWLLGLAALPLLTPAVLRFVSYSVALPIVMAREAFGAGALATSRARMTGHRWPALLALLAGSLPWLALTVLTSPLDGTLTTLMQSTPLSDLAPSPPSPHAMTLGLVLSALLGLVVQAPLTLLSVVLHRALGARS